MDAANVVLRAAQAMVTDLFDSVARIHRDRPPSGTAMLAASADLLDTVFEADLAAFGSQAPQLAKRYQTAC